MEDALRLGEFAQTLEAANVRRADRLRDLRERLDLSRVYLFGYGGKGRGLAWDIRKNSTTSVVVYDSSIEKRRAASGDGFETVDSIEALGGHSRGVILAACQAQLEQAGLVSRNPIFYQEAAYVFDTPHLSSKAREFSAWTMANIESLYVVYRGVHPRSRGTLLDVLRFRLSLDPADLSRQRRGNDEMWFDVLEEHSTRRYQTFLDVGAYDGDTLRQAVKRLAVTRGIAVEANSALFDSIAKVAASYEDGVLTLPHAAWSHSCRLRLSEVRGGMISVSEAPDGDLVAAPIDEGVHEPVDLIKMDIEGAEIAALGGCTRTLAALPDLAIAAYHRPEDLVALPSLLYDHGYAQPGFTLHVGHYSDCFDDTILYWLRNKRDT
jgi:FkbM family methyltransferase